MIVPDETSVTTLDDPRTLRHFIHGFTISQAVFVAASLGLADLLDSGPQTCDELARLTATNPGALYRLMRALASLGLFFEDEQQYFRLTAMGELLRSDVPGSLRNESLMFGAEPYRALSGLLHSVSTGETAFDHLFGMSHLEYLSQHPAAGRIFNQAMAQMSARVAEEVRSSYDFSDVDTLVDVGGGHGVLLAAILNSNPRMRGVLYELPHAVGGSRAVLSREGVLDRVAVVTGDALESIPAGADMYMMKSVIHLLEDEIAGKLLANCRNAMSHDGRLLLIERVIPSGNNPSWGKFVDLVMLTVTGGRERTEAEYASLLVTTGFSLQRTIPLPSGFAIVESKLTRP